MKIFLTNDDGYFADGIRVLAERLLLDGHELTVVAPSEEQSGVGHSLSLRKLLSFRPAEGFSQGIRAYTLNGTPADCVKFGLLELCKDEKFDMVVSGINNVLNLGTDIIYSGTFNAAMEGTISGVPSIAVSTKCKDNDYAFCADFTARNLEKFLIPELENCTLNINIPFTKKELNKGVMVTSLGSVMYTDSYRVVTDAIEPEKREFMLYGKPIVDTPNPPDCDFLQSREGYITITPIQIHATDKAAMKSLETKGIKID